MTKTKTFISIAATCIVAAFFFAGCATHRQADDIMAKLNEVEGQNRQVATQVAAMDSTIMQESLESKKLRTDMNLTIDELQKQISSLLENYNELMQKLDDIRKVPRSTKVDTTSIIKSSPGAQDTGKSGMTSQAITDCDNAYDESFILVRSGEYVKAIEGFRKYLATCDKHNRTENAHYWIGESYYALEKYADAITEFNGLLSQYKNSSFTGKALYKLGRSQQELGKKADAKKTFQRIIDEFPNTLESEQSRERLKDLR